MSFIYICTYLHVLIIIHVRFDLYVSDALSEDLLVHAFVYTTETLNKRKNIVWGKPEQVTMHVMYGIVRVWHL